LKRAFDKLRFCAGLVWTVGLTVEVNFVLKFLWPSVDTP